MVAQLYGLFLPRGHRSTGADVSVQHRRIHLWYGGEHRGQPGHPYDSLLLQHTPPQDVRSRVQRLLAPDLLLRHCRPAHPSFERRHWKHNERDRDRKQHWSGPRYTIQSWEMFALWYLFNGVTLYIYVFQFCLFFG